MEMEREIREYQRFDNVAQSIWATGDFNEKKDMILRAIRSFEFKKKTDRFVEAINKLSNNMAGCQKIDKMIADLVLIQSGDKAIR